MKRAVDLSEEEARRVEEALAGLKVKKRPGEVPKGSLLALKLKRPGVRKMLGFDPLAGEELEHLKPFVKIGRERV